MAKKAINLKDDLKNRIFSDSIMNGNVLYISGQVGTVEGDDNSFEKQFRRVMEKLSLILKKADMSLENVLRLGVYLKERNDFQKMNQLFTEFFPENATDDIYCGQFYLWTGTSSFNNKQG